MIFSTDEDIFICWKPQVLIQNFTTDATRSFEEIELAVPKPNDKSTKVDEDSAIKIIRL